MISRIVSLALWGGLFLMSPLASFGVFLRVSGPEVVYDLEESQGRLWLASSSGLFTVRGTETEFVPNIVEPRVLEDIEGDLWVGTVDRLWRFDGSKWHDVIQMRVPIVTAIFQTEGKVYVGTSTQLFEVTTGRTEIADRIRGVQVIQGDVWVVGARNLYRMNEESEFVTAIDGGLAASGLWEVDGRLWVTLIKSFELGRFDSPRRIEKVYDAEFQYKDIEVPELRDHEVSSIASVDGRPWFATPRGIVREAAGSSGRHELVRFSNPVNALYQTPNGVLVGTTKGPYLANALGNSEPYRLLCGSILAVKGFKSERGNIWMLTRYGLYLYLPRFDLRFDLDSLRITDSADLLFGHLLSVDDFWYEQKSISEWTRQEGQQAGKQPYYEVDNPSARWAIGTEPEGVCYGEDIFSQAGATMPLDERHDLEFGFRTRHVRVLDGYGNSSAVVEKLFVVLPGLRVLLAFFGICIVMFLMSRHLRNQRSS